MYLPFPYLSHFPFLLVFTTFPSLSLNLLPFLDHVLLILPFPIYQFYLWFTFPFPTSSIFLSCSSPIFPSHPSFPFHTFLLSHPFPFLLSLPFCPYITFPLPFIFLSLLYACFPLSLISPFFLPPLPLPSPPLSLSYPTCPLTFLSLLSLLCIFPLP